MDLVPNHTSSEHPWFQEALAGAAGQRRADRYIFRDGRGPGGAEPPNNWQSVFGGPSWTRVVEPDGNPGQWYLHLFDVEQPDLNWDNPEVFDDLEKTLRFWLERGVDGFRIDVAHGMAKPPGLPDTDVEMRPRMLSDGDPRFNHPNVHAIHRNIRRVMNDYPGGGDDRRGLGVRQRQLGRVRARRRAAPGLQFPHGASRIRPHRDPRFDREHP